MCLIYMSHIHNCHIYCYVSQIKLGSRWHLEPYMDSSHRTLVSYVAHDHMSTLQTCMSTYQTTVCVHVYTALFGCFAMAVFSIAQAVHVSHL